MAGKQKGQNQIFRRGIETRKSPATVLGLIQPATNTGCISMKIHNQNNSTELLAYHTAEQFMNIDFPERSFLLDPLIPEQSLSMIHAQRGIGKTYFALEMACAVASGTEFLKWSAPIPQTVAYFDAELPSTEFYRRLSKSGITEEGKKNLIIVSQEHQKTGMPDLSTKHGQDKCLDLLRKVNLVVFDNLSSLIRTGDENSAEDQHLFIEFLLQLRRQGISVILIHHSGKTGQQRGTSRREDLLDLVLALKPSPLGSSTGASFEVHFEKHRHLFGKVIEPFTAQLSPDGTWSMPTTESVARRSYRPLYEQGLTDADIATKTGKHRSTVKRALDSMVATGSLKPLPHDTKRLQLVP